MKYIRLLISRINRAMEQGNRGLLRRCLISAAATMLLLLLYGIIFSFSAQDAEESGSISYLVSEKCVEIADSVSGRNWTEDFKETIIRQIEHPIRKLAHFSEYACMGVLICTLCRQWQKRSRGLYLLMILWVFISAAADEFHQYFVPGRWSSPADVLLDTCGGAFGILFCILLEKIYRNVFYKADISL